MILREPPIEHDHSPVKIAWLTGLSDPRDCPLSDAQADFLRRLKAPEEYKVYRNFPYLPCRGTRRPRPALLAASFANAVQFARAAGVGIGSRAYRGAALAHWESFVRSADRILLIAGSCGLEIANACLAAGDGGLRRDVRIVALGPVARRRGPGERLLVQGESDAISRIFFRRVDCRVPSVGHMGYLANDSVFEIVDRWIADNTSNSRASADTFRDAS